ncbi:MAG: DnaA ATPase domain-containing protein [Planctomycetaceae bacterium]
MGNAKTVVATHADGSSAAAVLRAFRGRIGDDRYAVWFGDAARVQVTDAEGGPAAVRIVVGAGFTHEWLCRTFRAEFSAAVREILGPAAAVTWEPEAEESTVSRASPPAASASAPPPATRQRQSFEPAPEAERRSTDGRQRSPRVPGARSTTAVRRAALRLEDFIVGPSNRMAFGAIEMAVTRPGEMSPLVVHGPSGVGKTHLLEGACERMRELHPAATAAWLSAEQFTTAFLQSLHGGGLPGFRRNCRGADLLVIDDVQFFAGKKATLLELQHTIDALQRLGRQVILGCDRELDALPEFGADLVTRCRGGMTARILPPDYDVRRGIVTAICSKRALAVPDDVVHYVASSMTRHARELHGAVNRLEATSTMLGVPITLGMAEEALSDLVRSSARSVRLADIERAVCKAFGIDGGCLQSSRRSRSTSHPRMLAMFLARKHTQAALAEIGSFFGRRSHSTVIAAQKAVDEWVASGTRIVLADATWDVDEAIRRVEDVLRAG